MAELGPQRRGERDYPMVAREGWPIVACFVLAAGILTGLAWYVLGSVGGPLVGTLTGVLALWAVWFFRDPVREVPRGESVVISPADGVCCHAGPGAPPAELGLTGGWTRVSVFMNVFNVHVNRAPIGGEVERVEYRAGKFFNASFDKASEHNERCGMVIRSGSGERVGCVQIAGLVARRIVCRVERGAHLERGERYGLIRFGSRVDVYLPEGVAAGVRVGQRMVAGETIIATLPAHGRSQGREGAFAGSAHGVEG
ncbi:MAG: phosphatidylserine decarboxylase [Phycisphaeraceae bacterium]|nr:phosphatidylserine decarboxylase [Phycisphaeraceae bacterium]MBX3407857.1 phosphatidylserine decarboxylase [Phycisphaeraceae bacterium]